MPKLLSQALIFRLAKDKLFVFVDWFCQDQRYSLFDI